ncbi:MAG: YjbQ family protein [Methanomicrobiaceae archaeon]|nr:YjbQ family protein [Methanomicrobiaceae archaeon]
MHTAVIDIITSGEGDIINITPQVNEIIAGSGIQTGIISLFIEGSTAALTTIEYESGVLSDLRRALSAISPDDVPYEHDLAWGDGNGRSHVKAALIGPSLTVPVRKGNAKLGTWQQLVILELDIRPSRTRKVHCTVIGE